MVSPERRCMVVEVQLGVPSAVAPLRPSAPVAKTAILENMQPYVGSSMPPHMREALGHIYR